MQTLVVVRYIGSTRIDSYTKQYLYYNGPIKIILDLPRKTSPAESLQPSCTQKNTHRNSSSLKSSANKISKPNPMADVRRLMRGLKRRRTPHALRSPNHTRVASNVWQPASTTNPPAIEPAYHWKKNRTRAHAKTLRRRLHTSEDSLDHAAATALPGQAEPPEPEVGKQDRVGIGDGGGGSTCRSARA